LASVGQRSVVAATTTEGWRTRFMALVSMARSGLFFGCPAFFGFTIYRERAGFFCRKNRGEAGCSSGALAIPKNATFPGSTMQPEDLSADGAQFHSMTGIGGGRIWLAYLRKTDGSSAIKLGQWGEPVLSPDGTKVFALTQRRRDGSFCSVADGSGEMQRLPRSRPASHFNGWMPDGKAVYFRRR